MENAQPDAAPAAHAGKWLALMATVAITLLFPSIFFGLLRVGQHCAIQDIFAGDDDAAALKIFSVTLIYSAVVLLLSRINKRLGFYPLLGAAVVLIAVAAVYAFALAVVPAVALAIVVFLMWQGRYHRAPINRWLAIGVLIPGVLAAVVIALKIRDELIYWSYGLS
ncbi:hypothetical protein [Lysobacter enzymogenes]|uniref:hypothetical protein n=1 Tax=Lysobacter enzymogenes TaxID=69 RepID=UPI00089AEFAF|nr:hypothetical protein [Lysobacter enzymogenes]SDW62697.1 hypothetical protein SAMN05421681_102387 [Lysobacter enzymogenes]